MAEWKWQRTDKTYPKEEKNYLCCKMIHGSPVFYVLSWSNDLYKVDEYDFHDKKGLCGFYDYNSEFGYCEVACDYWTEIKWGTK